MLRRNYSLSFAVHLYGMYFVFGHLYQMQNIWQEVCSHFSYLFDPFEILPSCCPKLPQGIVHKNHKNTSNIKHWSHYIKTLIKIAKNIHPRAAIHSNVIKKTTEKALPLFTYGMRSKTELGEPHKQGNSIVGGNRSEGLLLGACQANLWLTGQLEVPTQWSTVHRKYVC